VGDSDRVDASSGRMDARDGEPVITRQLPRNSRRRMWEHVPRCELTGPDAEW
jgi:hypothetical protein